jgi:hypothetical protein
VLREQTVQQGLMTLPPRRPPQHEGGRTGFLSRRDLGLASKRTQHRVLRAPFSCSAAAQAATQGVSRRVLPRASRRLRAAQTRVF